MAGIYIHIPFCKQRCSYCDFYTRVAPLQIETTVKAIAREIELRSNYLQNETINTIYFGGGTPSLLKPQHFELIFDQINNYFRIDSKAEITFEANPDDLDTHFFESVSQIPFNRISMGIQTFDDIQLKKINRRHTGKDAIDAYQNARKAGFSNISVDIIYGLPDQSPQNWEIQLKKAIELHPEHISVYGLTYEPGTPLHKQRELGKVNNAPDEIMIEMHLRALELLQKAGYEAYEVSNYALKGFRSQHNSAYWKGQKYLGIGPSAHSFDGNSRQWNLSSLKDYNQAIENNLTFSEKEELSIQDKYNEYIMVGLRTAEGINIEFVSRNFGIDYANYFTDKSAGYINSRKMLQKENQFSLTTSGLLISNTIIEDLIRIS